ncbi:MAG: amino acid deaminase/aldolase [Nitriliruptorales bacterium]|nr:amino acid deaminase/aldolase [Nitriliruptorales bacterium]
MGELRSRYERALADIEPPYAFVDLDAMWANARDLLGRAAGKPIRVASKSVRCRPLLTRILDRDDGFRGLLTFTLAESLWLAENGFDDLVVAYPTTDREALGRLGELEAPRPVLMVDSTEHLDLIEEAGRGRTVDVCLDVDAGWHIAGGRVRIGPKRSPVHDGAAAVALAREIDRRAGVRLVGVMSYEGHVAGVGDRPPGRPLYGAAVRAMQRLSSTELVERRGKIVAAVREVADLRFVNGGGTGSLEMTAADPSVTELAAGSGFYAPHLFDHYGHFSLRPAAAFGLAVVRKPSPSIATTLGGGYLASGPADSQRLPVPWLPEGLRFDRDEGAGEVQTPLLGSAAEALEVGDVVFFRHAKAGELCERFDRLHLVAGDEVVDVLPTYRGEGQTFL